MRDEFDPEFMSSYSGFKSSSIQHDAHFLNYGLIWSKMGIYDGYSLGWCYHGNLSVFVSVRSNPCSSSAPASGPNMVMVAGNRDGNGKKHQC